MALAEAEQLFGSKIKRAEHQGTPGSASAMTKLEQ